MSVVLKRYGAFSMQKNKEVRYVKSKSQKEQGSGYSILADSSGVACGYYLRKTGYGCRRNDVGQVLYHHE